jgi:hypothetical protein
MIRYILGFVFLITILGCDTSSNIKLPDNSYFIKYFGADGNQEAVDLIVNKDGTFFILGNSKKSEDAKTQVYIAKADALGKLLWQKTFGNVEMDAKDFLVTSDGKLAVVANKLSGSNMDVLLSRYTLDGTPVDSVLLFATTVNAFSEYSNSLIQLGDGGFIVEGYLTGNGNQSDEMHLRVDKQLQKLPVWSEINGAGSINAGTTVVQHSSGVFYVFGYTNASYLGQGKTQVNYWAYKLGANGVAIDNGDYSEFEQAGSGLDKTLTDALPAAIGGFLLVGISNSTSFSLKASITNSTDTSFSLSAAGVFQDVILLNNLGSGPNPYATAFSSTLYNFILVNTYNTASAKSDILLMKVDNALAPIWGPVEFGGDGEDNAAAVAELPDGHIMILGTMNLGNPPEQNKIALIKLNSQGKLSP